MLLTTALLTAAALGGDHAPAALSWFSGSYDEAVEAARSRDTMVLVYCWMDSEKCSQLYQETLLDPRAAEPLNELVLVSAGHADPVGYELMTKLNVRTLPTLFFVDGEGRVEDLVSGVLPTDTLLHELERIRSGELTVSDLSRLVDESEKGSEENLGARQRLATKYADLGLHGEQAGLLASIRELDPRGRTEAGGNLLFQDTMMEVAEEGGGDEHFSEWNLKPLYKVASKVKAPAAKFASYNRIADLELGQENPESACRAYMKAWKYIADDAVLGWGTDVAHWLVDGERELGKQERRFALEVAQRVHESAAVKAHEACNREEESERISREDANAWVAEKLGLLGRAYALVGDHEMAVTTATKVVELSPTDENRARLEELRSQT